MAFREWGYYELMAGGLFTACPLLLLALAAPFLRRRMHRSGYWGLATCSLALAVLLAVFDSHTAGLGWRYICDFGWMMAIASPPGCMRYSIAALAPIWVMVVW